MRPQKRIFIGLLVLSCLILSLVPFFLWCVPMVGFASIHPTLPIIFTVLLAVAVLFMLLGGLLIVLTILRGKDVFFSHKLRGVVKGMFPFMILMGKVLGI